MIGHPEEQRPLPADIGQAQRQRRPRVHRTDQVPEVAANAPPQADRQGDEQAAADLVCKAHRACSIGGYRSCVIRLQYFASRRG